jgi:hypothetical protein
MNKVVVNIPSEVSIYIQKLFYEYNAYLNILAHLANECKSKDYFDEYMKDSVQKNIELEIAKSSVSNQYKPEGDILSYLFDFENATIIYEVK